MASVRSCQRLVQPTPAGSRMDPLLTKAEPIRNDNNAAKITYSRMKKRYCTDVPAAREEKRENM